MRYKPSKFNFVHKCENGELRLYNSWEGTKSLSIIPLEYAEDVITLLKNGTDSENKKCESFLIDHGFLVPEERDEDDCRRLRIMEETVDSTLFLIILPTEQCNFRCRYCYETFEKGTMDVSVQKSIVKYVSKNIYKFTGLHVSWFGGEPLEAIDVISYLSEEFIKICRTAKKPYTATMTTNGYNLSLDTFNKLYDYKVFNYQITIDGLENEHNSQRIHKDGSGTFNKIVENLLNIKRASGHFGTYFTIRTNFTKKIVAHLADYVSFYSKHFGDDQRFGVYINLASDWGGERVKEFSDNLLSHSYYRQILKNIQRLNVKLNYGLHRVRFGWKDTVCYAARKNAVVIGSDGFLYKCTSDFTYEKNKVGILATNGELKYNENYHLWLSGLYPVNKKCGECFYSACCLFMTCPAVRVKGSADITACPIEKENAGLLLELFDNTQFAVF
jgi:uncharacterized protein